MTLRHTRRCNWTTTPYQPRRVPTEQQRTQARSQAHDTHVQSAATCPMCGAPMLACRCADEFDPAMLESDYERRFHEKPDVIQMRML